MVPYVRCGGSFTCAARELNIKLSNGLRTELVHLDNNLERYRYAFRRQWDGFTLPTYKASIRDAQKVNSSIVLYLLVWYLGDQPAAKPVE